MEKTKFWNNIRKIDESQMYKDLIRDKNIYHVPIVSMSDHVDRVFDLSCDGNINRLVTYYDRLNYPYKSAKILLPANSKNKEFVQANLVDVNANQVRNFIEYDVDYRCEVKYLDKFPNNARDQRLKKDLVEYIESDIDYKNSDIAIFESQALCLYFLKNRQKDINSEIWYWCPVSSTETNTRSFLKDYDPYDAEVFDEADGIIVASKQQKDYIQKYWPHRKVILLPILMNRDLEAFDYNSNEDIKEYLDRASRPIIYMPYRLSDEGYKSSMIFESLLSLMESGKEFEVWITDPNKSGIYEDFVNRVPEQYKELIKHISSDRSTYYTILDYGKTVIIPYLEDLDFINHCAIFEFMSDESIVKVITSEDLKK